MKRFIIILYYTFIFFGCNSKKEDPKPIQDTPILTNTISGINSTTGINQHPKTYTGINELKIEFTTDTLFLSSGIVNSYITPIIKNNGNFTYKIELLPTISGFQLQILKSGVITKSGNLLPGKYLINIIASDSLGVLKRFDSILHIIAVEYRYNQSGISLGSVFDPPLSLNYAPSELNISVNSSAQSTPPMVQGGTNNRYIIVNNSSNFFSIDSITGVISAKEGLTSGTYSLTIGVKNASGTRIFLDAFKINVISQILPPSSLKYSPSSKTFMVNVGGFSSGPYLEGTYPITFTGAILPNTNFITINQSTGIVEVHPSAPIGNYKISINASNSVGSQLFTDVFEVQIVPPNPPSGITYSNATLILNQGSTINSSIPIVDGMGPFTFSVSGINGITINSNNGQITVASIASVGTYHLNVAVTNQGGRSVFSNVLTVEVNPPPISYDLQIQPLLNSYGCYHCHALDYNTIRIKTGPSSNVNSILNRINRTQGSLGFMPSGGSKLTPDQINLIQQWYDTGMSP
ncbi:MAG: hypothetical protein SFY32_06100 [Bacteroidota bacterium]|nr:hypothetical protein [Bacteroidota bacterium]